MFIVVPVFAKGDVSVVSIKSIDASENVNISEEKMEVSFNDLDQYAKYEVVLKNNTDQELFINELNVSNSSEDFIYYVFFFLTGHRGRHPLQSKLEFVIDLFAI